VSNDLTFQDHAELWAREQDIPIPARNTDAWKNLYERWVDYAFEGIGEED